MRIIGSINIQVKRNTHHGKIVSAIILVLGPGPG